MILEQISELENKIQIGHKLLALTEKLDYNITSLFDTKIEDVGEVIRMCNIVQSYGNGYATYTIGTDALAVNLVLQAYPACHGKRIIDMYHTIVNTGRNLYDVDNIVISLFNQQTEWSQVPYYYNQAINQGLVITDAEERLNPDIAQLKKNYSTYRNNLGFMSSWLQFYKKTLNKADANLSCNKNTTNPGKVADWKTMLGKPDSFLYERILSSYLFEAYQKLTGFYVQNVEQEVLSDGTLIYNLMGYQEATTPITYQQKTRYEAEAELRLKAEIEKSITDTFSKDFEKLDTLISKYSYLLNG